MSIASEITRLQEAKADIKASINAKGGTLTDETFDSYAAAIDLIESGGGTNQTKWLRNIRISQIAGSVTEETVTLDLANCTAYDILAEGTGANPVGYKHIVITNMKTTQMNCNRFCNTHYQSGDSSIWMEDITFDGVLYPAETAPTLFGGNRTIKHINGVINLSNCTNNDSIIHDCARLETVSFVANTIKASIRAAVSVGLNTQSLISIANGLDAAAATKTLTMHATSKTNMNNIMVDDISGTAVAGTAMTLTAFITNVKGWTIA